MPSTTATITPEQRDGIYELVRNHLGAIGDIWIAFEQDKEFVLAERLGLEFGEDFRLLQDIGWAFRRPPRCSRGAPGQLRDDRGRRRHLLCPAQTSTRWGRRAT